MDLITALQARTSCPKLHEPGPSEAQLEVMFRCALRAPDHGLLRPWRYLVFRGEARRALGELLVAAERERHPAATAEALEKVRQNPLRAPLVIACVAVIDPAHPKIPRIEQVASMAAAVQNLQLAAMALGFGAMWRTGPLASDVRVKEGLGVASADEIVAFLYVGTPAAEPKPHAPLAVQDFVTTWPQ